MKADHAAPPLRGRIVLGIFLASVSFVCSASSVKEKTENSSLKTLRDLISVEIAKDSTIAAAFLRLAFHDALTFDLISRKGGANGSIRFELERPENTGLLRAVRVLTPTQNSTGIGWGDIIAFAGSVAVESTGGPRIPILLGRKDATGSDSPGVIPGPGSSLVQLRNQFHPRGFTDRDLCALSGGHTLGRVRFGSSFTASPNKFQNDYFKNLMWFQMQREDGLPESSGPPNKPNFQLPSDLALLDDPSTREIVEEFAEDEETFFDAFVLAYTKLTSLGNLLGN